MVKGGADAAGRAESDAAESVATSRTPQAVCPGPRQPAAARRTADRRRLPGKATSTRAGQRPARGTPPPRRRCAIEPHAGQEGCLVIVSWQRHRTGCRRSPVRTLPLPPVAFASVAPLCCDLRCCSRTVVVSKLRRTSAFFFFLVAAARPIFESEICSSLQVEAVEKLADGIGA